MHKIYSLLAQKAVNLTHEITINSLLTNSPQLRVLFVPKQNYLPQQNIPTIMHKFFKKVFFSSGSIQQPNRLLLVSLQTWNIYMKQILKGNYLQKFKTLHNCN